jgi:selenocysteine-specific elongation factor
MLISPSNTFAPSSMLDAIVHLLPNASKALKHRSAIRFHHGSAELLGRLYLLEGDQLRPGDSVLAQLRLQSPTVCCPKDHFILRRYSPMTTIGGGVILDSIPQKHRKKDLAHDVVELRKLWSMLKTKDPQFDRALVEYFVKLRHFSGMNLPELVSRTGFLEDYLFDLLKGLDSVVLISQEPRLAVFRPALEKLKAQVVDFLANFHSSNPLAAGIPREELKERFFGKAKSSYFTFVLTQLENDGKLQIKGSSVSQQGRQAVLSPQQDKAREEILQLILSTGLQPPTLDELLRKLPYEPGLVRDVYFFLLQQGELVRISENIVLSPDRITFLTTQLKESFPSGHTFTVGEFKDLFRISRKYAIPFLEFLDRKRITRRMGDKRLVL